MNTEYALDSIKAILTSEIATTLATLKAEAASTITVASPAEYKIGDLMPTEFTMYPAIFIRANTTSPNEDQEDFQETTLNFVVVCWQVDVDAETLHRGIVRYGDAITRILRKSDNWESWLHSPRIRNATYSELYTVPHGIAQGCAVEGTIEFII